MSKVALKYTLICLIFISFTRPVLSQTMEIPFRILNYIPSAKAMGMGDAYTVLCNDITSVYFNPGGLASLYQTQIYGTYQLLFNASYWMAGVGFYKKNIGSFGFAVNYLGNNDFFYSPGDKKNIEPASQLLILAGFGQHFRSLEKTDSSHDLDFGITLKYIKYSFIVEESYGFGFDMGLKMISKPYTFLRDFTFGFILQSAIKAKRKTVYNPFYDPGTFKQEIDDNDWYFPKLKGGILYSGLNEDLSIEFDISKVFFTESLVQYNFGINYQLLRSFEIRAGYNNGAAFGIGLNFNNVGFNSGFNNNKDLGFVGQFDMTFGFF